jgi:CRP/FNR family transcriptional regulator, anaerobic regulatory protein
MDKLSDKKLIYNNNKLRKRLFSILKLIAKQKETSHLISTQIFAKKQFLVKEKEPVKGIYFVLKGSIKIYNTGLNNKYQILRLASKSDIVGFSSLNSTHYWASAIAMEYIKAYFINIEDLQLVLNINSSLSLLLINSLAFELRHYEIRQKHKSLFPASERVIDTILLIAFKFGKETCEGIEISTCTARKDIASFSNTSLEKTIRTLSYLKSKDMIDVNNTVILIKNKDELINKLKLYCCKDDIGKKNRKNSCYPEMYY